MSSLFSVSNVASEQRVEVPTPLFATVTKRKLVCFEIEINCDAFSFQI